MQLLFLGAGATGGYFGGRLAEAGLDVTFLLRPRRAALIRAKGLIIHSPFGDATLHPAVVTDAARAPTPEVIFLTCKSYDLSAAMGAIAPAVGEHTAIVPLLNGMEHLERLDERFGARHVLGGRCAIHSEIAADGSIRHWGYFHRMRFGERDGSQSPRVAALARACAGANMDCEASRHIVADMWDKWVMLASLAGTLCLMRADLATVLAAPGGTAIFEAAVAECAAVATAAGHAPRASLMQWIRGLVAQPPPEMTASMLRDLQQGRRVEADHVIGDLIRRARSFDVATPVLDAAYCHLKCYEALAAGSASAAASGNSTSV
ncbi:MAG TPA: 2-dehydropantoate 2-reductase [Nevskiaceae bacterium]